MRGSLGWVSSGRPVKYGFGEAAGKLWRSAMMIFIPMRKTKTTSESGQNDWKSFRRQVGTLEQIRRWEKKSMSETGKQIVHQRLSGAFSLALTQTEHIRARRARCQTKRNALIEQSRGESY